MRRFIITAIAICAVSAVFAQTDSTVAPKKKAISARSGDHFMFQLGYTAWSSKPDSIHTTGLPRTFNAYLMFDFPFKSNPHLSVAIGPGISTDNIYFDKMYVGIKDPGTAVRFQDLADTSHFKKYKMATAYLEAPVELRFRSNPDDDGKSFKAAIGVKVGTLLSATMKGKDLVDKNGNAIIVYTQKEKSKRYFNSTRLSGMVRVGYGHFTLFGTYSFTPLFKEGAGPQVQPFTIGLNLSGL